MRALAYLHKLRTIARIDDISVVCECVFGFVATAIVCHRRSPVAVTNISQFLGLFGNGQQGVTASIFDFAYYCHLSIYWCHRQLYSIVLCVRGRIKTVYPCCMHVTVAGGSWSEAVCRALYMFSFMFASAMPSHAHRQRWAMWLTPPAMLNFVSLNGLYNKIL